MRVNNSTGPNFNGFLVIHPKGNKKEVMSILSTINRNNPTGFVIASRKNTSSQYKFIDLLGKKMDYFKTLFKRGTDVVRIKASIPDENNGKLLNALTKKNVKFSYYSDVKALNSKEVLDRSVVLEHEPFKFGKPFIILTFKS